MRSFHLLNYVQKDRIAYITLNRPDQQNRLNDSFMSELKEAINQAEQKEDVKLIILNAEGGTFCEGIDVDYMRKIQAFNMDENLADSSAFAQILLKIYRSTKIFIAEVEGNAFAEGCGLASVCDFIFAIPEAKFSFNEVKVGLVPAISMPFLLRKVGETRTKQLMLSGDFFSAEQAMAYQLISEIVPREEIQGYVETFAQKLCAQSSAMAIQLTKKMIADIPEFPLEHAVKFAAKMNAYARATEDSVKGIKAFVDEEKLEW